MIFKSNNCAARRSGRSFAYACAAVCIAGMAQSAQAFEYTGNEGPGFWGHIAEACGGAAADARQSPINITGTVIEPALGALQLQIADTPMHILNNGHAIEVEYDQATPSTLVFNNTTYTLLQFHVHSLSEHTVGDKRGQMELHAVFRAEDGTLAVIGQIFDIGAPNAFLQSMIDAGLPKLAGETTINHELTLNVADALIDTAAYYTYDGSLTTPPCSEIVSWIVLKNNATMSADQFTAFRNILGNNFRPLQALNNRVVKATPRGGLAGTRK